MGRWLLAVVLVIGCSESADSRSAIVSGKVTLGGIPVSAGTVLFMTENGHAATADIGADGSYTVHCRPDRFKVAVTPPAEPDPLAADTNVSKSEPQSRLIPQRYYDLGTSGLSVEVKQGENTYDIALTK